MKGMQGSCIWEGMVQFWISDFGFRISDFGFGIGDCGFRIGKGIEQRALGMEYLARRARRDVGRDGDMVNCELRNSNCGLETGSTG